jgi:hypothetical protein
MISSSRSLKNSHPFHRQRPALRLLYRPSAERAVDERVGIAGIPIPYRILRAGGAFIGDFDQPLLGNLG